MTPLEALKAIEDLVVPIAVEGNPDDAINICCAIYRISRTAQVLASLATEPP